MKIGIDIDDTITNTFDYLIPYIADYLNISKEYLLKNNISYSNIPKDLNFDIQKFVTIYCENFMTNVPLKNGAKEYINKLKELGHDIVIITARDEKRYDKAYELTKNYLIRNGIKYDKLICNEDKAICCKQENIDLFIDDSITNCRKINDTGVQVLLFDAVHNKNTDEFKRVKTWEEIYEIIR